MRQPWIMTLALFIWLSPGCTKAPKGAPEEASVKPEETTKKSATLTPQKTKADAPKTLSAEAQKAPAKPVVKQGAAKPLAKRAKKNRASKLVAWDAPIEWLDWDAGLAKAKAEKKAIMLLVFADW